MSSTSRVAIVGILLALVAIAAGIKCWQCGQYSDGVGSITPCNNRSAARLNQCPPDAKYCISFILEFLVLTEWTKSSFSKISCLTPQSCASNEDSVDLKYI
ncbi:unnamed protein product [Euphydryas editha]|uniref:UPAR/Ly6 domain-containing protein n=1 Tax=Euphydryas editha TaxID=104508 RepID=A0AAU9UDZ0_EUPED|nr:unnamed protein product [Euphydryas editha]